jgi:hypothetical protein
MKQLLASAVVFALTLGAPAAHAKCESVTKGAETLAGDQLVSQYKKVVACDPKVANQVFPTFMRGAGDADTLLALAMVAIDADIWNAVWEMVGKLSSYEARDEVAERIGMACEYNPKVVGFLEGAYFGLRDIDFTQWDDALVACQASGFAAWLQQQVENPPPKLYDDKWNALADALVRRLGPDALTVLATSAVVAAGNGGPFESILMKMETAVAPELGEAMNPADQARLEEALVGMAQQLGAEKARAIADRLANAGSDSKAAELLPTVYPGRAQGGVYWYGAITVEAGDCEGDGKTAIMHTALVGDPGARWIITTAVEGPLRSVKPKLSKCTVDAPWPVLTSPEPFSDKGEMDPWVAGLVNEWTAKGYAVKLKAEKEIRLP